MFKNVQADSDNMIVEIREYLDFISQNHPPPPAAIPRYINTAKGLIYVQLYGVIENTVINTVSTTINYINAENTNISNLNPCIHALILNDELNSLINVNSKKWDKRHHLFERIHLDDIAVISNVLFPTDGKNIGLDQLNTIWKTFGLTAPIFKDITFSSRLKDIVANRINVAHGNVSPSEVGKIVTTTDLYARLQDVSSYCSYLISTFEDYVNKKKYLK
jgi:hypothetical protein